MKTWFRMEVSASDPTVAEIQIFDIIGDWIDEQINQIFGVELTVTAKSFLKQLAELPSAVATIRVHINSVGGDCFAAAAIANALRDQQLSKGRTVETVVDGIAASAASVILMAGRKVTMSDNGLIFLHDPWTGSVGNARQLRQAADGLDRVRDTIVSTYQWHSQLSKDEIVALMSAETWMDADEAIANGFATDKVEGLKAAALIDPKAVMKLGVVPEKYRDRLQAFVRPEPEPEPKPVPAAAVDVLQACTAGGCLEIAESLVAANATLEVVKAKVAETQATKVAAQTRADAITRLCAHAKAPELAAGYIAGAMSVDAVKGHLTTITAKLDKVEIDTGLRPDAHVKTKARMSTTSIYEDMNKGASA
jgi:ATP-dependent protease ClpP protease subunit